MSTRRHVRVSCLSLAIRVQFRFKTIGLELGLESEKFP